MTLDPTIEARVRAKREAPLDQDADVLALLDEVERLRAEARLDVEAYVVSLCDEQASVERMAGRHGRADAYDYVAACVSHRSKPPHAVVLDQVRRAHSAEREARQKAEAERDAAIAACAEIRAAAVGVDGRCRLCTASPREHRDSCALVFTRDEVVGGRVVLDGEEEARVQSALELVTSDPEADMLHATTRDAVSDALALLKGKVTTT